MFENEPDHLPEALDCLFASQMNAEDLLRLVVERGGIGYNDLMALAERDSDRDRLLVLAESMASGELPRLRRVFVDRMTNAELTNERIARLFALATTGESAVYDGIDVVYRPL